jgi:prepilin-type N-terminal cleavage/methylation domain-containing protein
MLNQQSAISSHQFSGFTLIEVLVVMGILTIITSLGYLVTVDFYKSYAFNAERDTIISLMQKARAQSLSNINQAGHGFYVNGNNYIVFQGLNYANRTSSYDQALSISPGISVSPQPFEADFGQISGTSSSLSLVLTDGKRSETISLNSEGQINW